MSPIIVRVDVSIREYCIPPVDLGVRSGLDVGFSEGWHKKKPQRLDARVLKFLPSVSTSGALRQPLA